MRPKHLTGPLPSSFLSATCGVAPKTGFVVPMTGNPSAVFPADRAIVYWPGLHKKSNQELHPNALSLI